MERTRGTLVLILVWAALPLLMQCHKIEVQPAPPSEDTSSIGFPSFTISLDSSGKGRFPLDSLRKKFSDFSLRFDPISVGTFQVDVASGIISFERSRTDWHIDSTQYELCRNGTCRKGKVVVKNFVLPDTSSGCDTLPVLGPFPVALLGQTIVTVWPRASWGKITALQTGYYSANVISTDSTKIRFRATGNPLYYGFDEVSYTITDSLGQCHTGTLLFSIGDPCETQATDDVVTLTGNLSTWPVSQFLSNDTSCDGLQENLLFRIAPDIGYGPNLSLSSPNGIRTDTTINGLPFFQYRKTNPTAQQDEFWYYVSDPGSGKITRARLKIIFP